MRTFAVSEVEPGTRGLPSIALAESLKPLAEILEAGASNLGSLVPSSGHAFVSAVHTAFSHHFPLHLSPDDVWLCIAQGFAQHVTVNAESLRKRFVSHEGKMLLRAVLPAYEPGSPQNDWAHVFAQFSSQIGAHIGKTRALIVADFSTTGPIERAASEIVLMSAMQKYFDYECTACGIPQIGLLGTVDDWQSVRRRVAVLAEFGVEQWVAALLPVLDRFVAAAQGAEDTAFWRSFYKLKDMSGGPYVSGWMNVLFPYLRAGEDGIVPNRLALDWDRRSSSVVGPTTYEFSSGLSTAPVKFTGAGEPWDGAFFGGFIGVSQDADTLAVRPAMGWAVSLVNEETAPRRVPLRDLGLCAMSSRETTARVVRLSTGEFQVWLAGSLGLLILESDCMLVAPALAAALQKLCGDELKLRPVEIVQRVPAETWSYFEVTVAAALDVPGSVRAALTRHRHVWRWRHMLVVSDEVRRALSAEFSGLEFDLDIEPEVTYP